MLHAVLEPLGEYELSPLKLFNIIII